MLKKLFAAFGAKSKARAAAPYDTEELNVVFRMLFADDAGQLFGETPDARVVQAIAQDVNEESRVRLLAAQWLRGNGHMPQAPEVLGVIIEVPLEGSLDTLAAYADGRVRYINHTGRTSVFEGAPEEVAAQAKILVATAIPAAVKGEAGKPPRLLRDGQLRLTFLAQEGNRSTEGYFSDIAKDPLAAPVLQQAQALLTLVIQRSLAS